MTDILKSALHLKNCLHQNPIDLTLKYCEKTGVVASAYNASSSGWSRRILFEASLGYMRSCYITFFPQINLLFCLSLPGAGIVGAYPVLTEWKMHWIPMHFTCWVKIWVSLDHFVPAYPMALASDHMPTSCLMHIAVAVFIGITKALLTCVTAVFRQT